jgi:hypothetical protein
MGDKFFSLAGIESVSFRVLILNFLSLAVKENWDQEGGKRTEGEDLGVWK